VHALLRHPDLSPDGSEQILVIADHANGSVAIPSDWLQAGESLEDATRRIITAQTSLRPCPMTGIVHLGMAHRAMHIVTPAHPGDVEDDADQHQWLATKDIDARLPSHQALRIHRALYALDRGHFLEPRLPYAVATTYQTEVAPTCS
jgi:ADP-ribose pyrophosphatase YjhB (NUDIX family)